MGHQVGHSGPVVKPEHHADVVGADAVETPTTFITQGTIPPVAGESAVGATASELGYGLTDEQIRALLASTKTEAALLALVRQHPADQQRIFELALETLTFDQLAVDSVRSALGGNAKQDELTKKHGIRPRKYDGALDGSNAAELVVREVMPEITAFLNTRAAAQKLDLRFTIAELTTNFLSEGGILALKANVISGLDGFQIAGVDTFMDRYQELQPWLHSCITRDKVAATENKNEKGESVRSIGSLTLVQAAYANATMYAAGKARLEKFLKRKGVEIEKTSDVEQFYWATMYYNAGEGVAEKNLAAKGVGDANTKWGRPDDWEKYSTNATYNAKMRTSTFEYTRDSVLDGGDFRDVPHENMGAAQHDASAYIADLRRNIATYTEWMTTYDTDVAHLADTIKINTGDPHGMSSVPQLQQQLDQLKAAKRSLPAMIQQLAILERAQANQLGATTTSTPAPTKTPDEP